MRIIKPNFIIEEQKNGISGVYKQIEWVGRHCYKSLDKITEDSAKTFVDNMVKSEHCYTGDTEVLTDRGWIKFKDYRGEKVAVINNDCSFKGFEIPKRVVNYKYKGNFYYYPSLGIEVTDGHNMFGVFRENKNDFYNNISYSLFKCNTLYRDNNGRVKTLGERMFKTPKHCSKPIYSNPYGELIGFWLGDGCYAPETKNKLIFHLKKSRKIEYLRRLCEELGYTFESRKSDYYTVTNHNIGSSFHSLYYNEGKRLSLNYFPSIDIAYSIIQGLINSDGSLGINTRTVTFTNTSKSIIDWLLIYAPLCGYTISYGGVSHNTSIENPVYRVYLLDTSYTLNNDSRNPDSKVIISCKDEEVYCVTVSTGLIMIRGTNGVTSICGNCAMLEHGTIYLKVKWYSFMLILFYFLNPYSKVKKWKYITSNYRVIIEGKRKKDLQYICEPTEFHEKRITVKFNIDRITGESFLRHRAIDEDHPELHYTVTKEVEKDINSFARESTRFCNYSKDKFSNNITFVQPSIVTFEYNYDTYYTFKDVVGNTQAECEWLTSCLDAEKHYFNLLALGWKPQNARYALGFSVYSPLVMTAFVEDWKHFFYLRTAESAHPDARELAIPLQQWFIQNNLIS